MCIASIDAFLGTVWWSVLMVAIGVVGGCYLRPQISRLLNNGNNKKK